MTLNFCVLRLILFQLSISHYLFYKILLYSLTCWILFLIYCIGFETY